MAGRHSKRGKGHKVETPDLELMPMLNVFISIIPMLLLSAAFVQLAVIDTGLPVTAAATTAATPDGAVDDAPAAVTIHLRAADWVVEREGSPSRSIARTGALEAADAPGRLQLEALLRSFATPEGRKPEVRIVPAVTTKYEEIIFIMDLARAAGLPDAALADAAPGVV